MNGYDNRLMRLFLVRPRMAGLFDLRTGSASVLPSSSLREGYG